MSLSQNVVSHEIAVSEGLRYVSDLKPGFTRKRKGKKFQFFDQQGRVIADQEIVHRIESIGIPPAYEKVWISPWANGHIQAIGYDSKGRKQYRYHIKWRAVRDQNKFDHMLSFGKSLPSIRQIVAADLKEAELSRRKIMATIVSLLEKTLIRVGNAEYAKQNDSYGLTTLRRKHVDVSGHTIRFHFTGKSGKEWKLALKDPRIAATIKRCSDLPGHELFKYVGKDGAVHEISSADVNNYLKEITKKELSAKDFRTWAGTVLAAVALSSSTSFETITQAKKNIKAAIDVVSKQLGNTPTICRKCYVHPVILESYLANELVRVTETTSMARPETARLGLSKEERTVLAFLRKRLKQAQQTKKTASKVASL